MQSSMAALLIKIVIGIMLIVLCVYTTIIVNLAVVQDMQYKALALHEVLLSIQLHQVIHNQAKIHKGLA